MLGKGVPVVNLFSPSTINQHSVKGHPVL